VKQAAGAFVFLAMVCSGVGSPSYPAFPYLLRLAAAGALIWLARVLWERILRLAPRWTAVTLWQVAVTVLVAAVYFAFDPTEAWRVTEIAATAMLFLTVAVRLFNPRSSLNY
jgi:hypothetical protein